MNFKVGDFILTIFDTGNKFINEVIFISNNMFQVKQIKSINNADCNAHNNHRFFFPNGLNVTHRLLTEEEVDLLKLELL